MRPVATCDGGVAEVARSFRPVGPLACVIGKKRERTGRVSERATVRMCMYVVPRPACVTRRVCLCCSDRFHSDYDGALLCVREGGVPDGSLARHVYRGCRVGTGLVVHSRTHKIS